MAENSVFPKKTTWGLILIAGANFLQLVSTVVGLTLVGSQMDPNQIAQNATMNIPGIMQACLAPLVVLLDLIAVILIITERKQLAAPHPRLALLALTTYILMALSSLGIGLPMSFLSTQNGSIPQAMLGMWGSMLGSVLGAVYPTLLVFGLAKPLQRALLGGASLAGVVSAAGMGAMTLSNFELKSMEVGAMTVYYPLPGIDMSSGIYQALSMVGIAATVLFFLAFLWLAIDYFRRLDQVVDERVV
jgi:hypothetical protein